MSINLSLHQQLIALRPQLLRFARQKMMNEIHAEDAVQETLLAVLENPDRYAGKSSLSTYVIGILKFKIIDDYRSKLYGRHFHRELTGSARNSSNLNCKISCNTCDNIAQGAPDAHKHAEEDSYDSTTIYAEQNVTSHIRYGITQSSLCCESNPLLELEQKNFFIQLENALHDLPPKNARAFTLSVCMELDSAEICAELGITKNNLLVSMHRARHALRRALVHLQ